MTAESGFDACQGQRFLSSQNCPHLPWGHAVLGIEYLEVAFSGGMETMPKLRVYRALHSLKEGGNNANLLAEVLPYIPVFCKSTAMT